MEESLGMNWRIKERTTNCVAMEMAGRGFLTAFFPFHRIHLLSLRKLCAWLP